MLFLDFKRHFEPFRIFSIRDVLKWDAGFDTRRLVEWQAKEYIVKVINRWYIFTDIPRDENFLFLTANRIYAPSYVSFESALSYYRLIPEGVYSVTSATSLKTNEFHTPIGSFTYKHLKPELMFGYQLVEAGERHYRMAQPEKVLLDYLYLNSTLRSPDDFSSLRLNLAELQTLLNEQRLNDYLSLFESKALEQRISVFLNTLQHA